MIWGLIDRINLIRFDFEESDDIVVSLRLLDHMKVMKARLLDRPKVKCVTSTRML